MRFALVLEIASCKFHLAREVDSPIAVQIIMSRRVANGQVIIGGFNFSYFDVSRSNGDEENVVVSLKKKNNGNLLME